MPLRFRGHDVGDFSALVAEYTDHEFASPMRSTVPLLAFWAQVDTRFAELGARLGLSEPRSCRFCFEYEVPVQRGQGRSSCTDLLVVEESTVVAIEGKFTEPPYQTVEDWLGDTPPENRREVLGGWLQLIAGVVGVDLRVEAVADLPYQMIHRTASACHPIAGRRWVLYHLFSENHLPYYRTNLENLRRLCGRSTDLQFGLLVTPPECTDRYENLRARWGAGERNLASEVRSGLLDDAFFQFNRIEFTEVV